MATRTMTSNFEVVTAPANTDQHTINVDGVLDKSYGEILVRRKSGTSVQFTSNGADVTTESGALDATDDRLILSVQKGILIKYKPGAGSEVFSLSVLRTF